MKTNIGPKLTLYPTQLGVVVTKVNGKITTFQLLILEQFHTKINQNNNKNNYNIENATNSKALVFYFSATGNTKRAAELIATHLDSKLYELEPVDPYTDADLAYSNPDSRVSQEGNDSNHLTELVNTDFDDFDEAEYIFLGAPIWWGQLSWVINDFLLSNDFTDKTIILFAKYFIGQSYLNPLNKDGVFIANVTFELGCRNNWHVHHATKGGGQILL